jgi:hypothetical protein
MMSRLFTLWLTRSPLIKRKEFVPLCTPLPLRILWGLTKALYLCPGFGDKISKADIGSIAR